jgi:hypothetical protein
VRARHRPQRVAGLVLVEAHRALPALPRLPHRRLRQTSYGRAGCRDGAEGEAAVLFVVVRSGVGSTMKTKKSASMFGSDCTM